MSYKNAISSSDPNALEKLTEKLAKLKEKHALEKAINAYYRKNGTLEGCPGISQKLKETLITAMQRPYHLEDKPISSYELQSNNQEMKRLEKRIGELQHRDEVGFVGWDFPGGKAVANAEINRLQLIFDEKPALEQHKMLRSEGFVFSRTNDAYQRQLNNNAIRAASRIDFVRPEDGTKPYDLQPKVSEKKENVR